MVHKSKLEEHPSNSNKQNRHVFEALKESIRQHGFDESLLVVPKEDGTGYWVVSGNHRFRAGEAEGITEFPCVIRDDWSEIDQQIQLVRRNYVRGQIDKEAFTVAVNTLSEAHNIPLEVIQDSMGFEDSDSFLELYKSEARANAMVERVKQEHAPKVKMIDDLGMVLSGIFEKYGDTVDQSFIVFPAGGKKHMYVAATPALKNLLSEIAERCITRHMDINLVLGGLLAIGLNESAFRNKPAGVEIVQQAEAAVPDVGDGIFEEQERSEYDDEEE
jgi:hypothetical protein